MKILFFCNTYYQLIVAIRMRTTLKRKDEVSLVLTNVSHNSEHVYSNLRKIGIFDRVFYLKLDEKDNMSTLKYLKEGIDGIVPEGMADSLFYDEFIGFNYDIPMCALYASLEKANKAIQCNVMEEGLLSYDTPDSDCRVAKWIRIFRKLLFKKNARERRKQFYCFNKKAYMGGFEPVGIPPIKTDDQEFKKVLFDVFLDGKEPDAFKEKYVYLSSVYDFEGETPARELEIAVKLADTVGYENVIVKAHPRDEVKRFKAMGLKVAENSSVPWEVIQIGCDFSQKVLVSSFSGSLINLNSIIENCGKSVYTNKLCDISGNSMAQYFSAMIDRYLCQAEELGLKNISSASTINEII